MKIRNFKKFDRLFSLYDAYYRNTPIICCYKQYNNLYVAVCKRNNKNSTYAVSVIEKTETRYIKRDDMSFPIVKKDKLKELIRFIINESKK